MLPPKDVYSAFVANQTSNDVTVEVHYGAFEGVDPITETLSLPANGNIELVNKTFARDGCTFNYAIKQVKIGDAVMNAPFPEVSSPVKGYKFTFNGALSGSM